MANCSLLVITLEFNILSVHLVHTTHCNIYVPSLVPRHQMSAVFESNKYWPTIKTGYNSIQSRNNLQYYIFYDYENVNLGQTHICLDV